MIHAEEEHVEAMSEASAKVPPRDMWLLLLSAVRYAMGRSTYIVDDTCNMVMRYQTSLTPAQLYQVADEVERALLRAREGGGWLGMQMDHQRWNRLVEAIRGLLKEGTDT